MIHILNMAPKKSNHNKRPTQKDIAQKSGFSRPTVSLALKGDPSVSEETRNIIRAAADAIGYVPDPMLTALSRYRNNQQTRSYHGTLAWIGFSTQRNQWDHITPYRHYHKGAVERAKKLGYNVEVFDVTQDGLNSNRLDSILKARGIHGLLICPPVDSEHKVVLPWDNYSLVTFGYTISEPRLHRVTSSHFQSTLEVFKRLHERGYQRIGFIFNQQVNIKTQQNSLAAYLSECQRVDQTALPPLIEPSITPAMIETWYEKYKPDAVILSSPDWIQMKETKIKVPEELGAACPMAPLSPSRLSGIVEQSFEIGVAAVDSLVHMIEHQNTGIPTHPRFTLLEGQWKEGSTLKPL